MATSYPIKGDADKKIGAYFAPLSVSAQDTPNMTVKVRAGAFFNSQNQMVEFAGGNSAALTLPLSGTSWTIVGLSDAGAITLTAGVSGATPSVPDLPAGVLPLAAVYLAPNTTSVTTALIHDIRPFARSIDNVPNLSTELANRPMFTDMNNALLTKADVDGTPNTTFALNKSFLVGTPNSNVVLSVKRGGSPDVSIRWNESLHVWEFTNDGTTFNALLSTTGTFAPLVHTHVASDITNFNTAVDARITSAIIPESQVTNLVSDLASKATVTALTTHTSDASIHFTLPIPESSVTNLVTDLASKVSIAAPGTLTGNLTVKTTGNQPIALTSSDTGSSGLLVDRTLVPGPDARFEWDESSQTWLIGITGTMNTVLTSAVISGKADKVTGATAGHLASLDVNGNLVDSGVVGANVVLNTRAINTGTGLSGGGNLTADRTIILANTTVVAAAYGSATTVPTFTVDAQGRLTAAADVAIAIPQSAVTNLTTDLSNKQPLDADLTAIAALAGNSGLLHTDGAGVWTVDVNTYLTTGTAASTYQPLDADLTAIAALTGTVGLLHTNGAGVWTVDTTAYVPTSRTITAGAGLTGGGDLSANRTLSVAALKGSTAFTFGAILANDVGDSTNTLTVTGAVVGDIVNLGLPSIVPAGFTYVGYVSAADTVTIRAHGSASSGTGAGAANATINVVVLQYAGF